MSAEEAQPATEHVPKRHVPIVAQCGNPAGARREPDMTDRSRKTPHQLNASYRTMKKFVDYLTSRAQNHIVAHGLGDWGDFPNVRDHVGWDQLTPISLCDTASYYYGAMILAQIAAILDEPDDAKRYAALAQRIRQAFNRAFFNPKTNWYASGTPIVPNEVRSEWNRALFDPWNDRCRVAARRWPVDAKGHGTRRHVRNCLCAYRGGRKGVGGWQTSRRSSRRGHNQHERRRGTVPR
jgi:hypothetical protein